MALGAHQQEDNCEIAPSMGIAADTIELQILLRFSFRFGLLFSLLICKCLDQWLLLWAISEWRLLYYIVEMICSSFMLLQRHMVVAIVEREVSVRHFRENLEDLLFSECLYLLQISRLELFESFISLLEEASCSVKLVSLHARCSYEVCKFYLFQCLICFFWLHQTCVQVSIELLNLFKCRE